MKFHPTNLQDAWLIELEPYGDARGTFARTMCTDDFGARGLVTSFVQQNMSTSSERGTIRGMHMQLPPHAEVKLIRCTRGAICDVIIDMRRDSPTFLAHQAFELTAENKLQLYAPAGFAHGFQSLVDDIELTYLVSAPYTPQSERGIRYDDPMIGIAWPLAVSVISTKDAEWPLLEDLSADPRVLSSV